MNFVQFRFISLLELMIILEVAYLQNGFDQSSPVGLMLNVVDYYDLIVSFRVLLSRRDIFMLFLQLWWVSSKRILFYLFKGSVFVTIMGNWLSEMGFWELK